MRFSLYLFLCLSFSFCLSVSLFFLLYFVSLSLFLGICSLALLVSLPDYVCTCMCVIHIRDVSTAPYIAWILTSSPVDFDFLHHYTLIASPFILSSYVCSRWHQRRRDLLRVTAVYRGDSVSHTYIYIFGVLSRELSSVPIYLRTYRQRYAILRITIYIFHACIAAIGQIVSFDDLVLMIFPRCHTPENTSRVIFHLLSRFTLRPTVYQTVRIP